VAVLFVIFQTPLHRQNALEPDHHMFRPSFEEGADYAEVDFGKTSVCVEIYSSEETKAGQQ
jgi:hypothetical protein